MTFTAKLKRGGTVWTLWRQHNRVGGVVEGVRFRWLPNDDYVTDELAGPQVAALRQHPEVILEMSGVAPPPPSAPSAITSVAVSAESQTTRGRIDNSPPLPVGLSSGRLTLGRAADAATTQPLSRHQQPQHPRRGR